MQLLIHAPKRAGAVWVARVTSDLGHHRRKRESGATDSRGRGAHVCFPLKAQKGFAVGAKPASGDKSETEAHAR